MTREQYHNLTGEWPEDMFGPDWENALEEMQDESDAIETIVSENN